MHVAKERERKERKRGGSERERERECIQSPDELVVLQV